MKKILEKKFSAIGFLDSDLLINELLNYNTISDKLNYLKSIKEKYYDKFQSVISDFSKDEEIYFYTGNNRIQFWESVFGNYKLVTSLAIQEPVFEHYFKNELNNPEFTFWFLKNAANEVFKHTIDSTVFKDKMSSNIKETFIKSELKQLEEQEQRAKDLLLNKELDIHNRHKNNYTYEKEVALLRVLDGNYYKNNCTSSLENWGSLDVQAYYKHILLKPYLVSKMNELPTTIKALFQFVEYLHSNIENFNQYNDLIKELEQLDKKRNELKPQTNYKDKLQHDKIQAELESKFKILQNNTANPIKAKAKELNVCSFENEPIYNFNGVETEIYQLKENFKNENLPEIFKHKSKYIEYRTKTHRDFLSLSFFFNELDEITKSLFDYFKDNELNEFEAFEKKTIKVNSIKEAIQVLTNKEQKDERYWLTSFSDEQEQNKHNYKSYQYQIENNGCFKVNKGTDSVKIYTPELAVILTSDELLARNMETQSETTVNGTNYLNTYIEAYKEGEQYFENEFKVSANTLYGANAEQYVKDIHLNFFHVQHTGANEGWGYVKKKYPIILTYKTVKEFGYYSGIVNKIEEQVEKYPRLFAAFDKCEHNLTPHPITKLKIDQIALKYVYEGLQVTRENGNDIAKEYGHNSGEKLFQRFTYFSSPANRKGKPNLCTPKKLDNKIKLIESIIDLLSIDKQGRVKDEVSILKKIYETEYQ